MPLSSASSEVARPSELTEGTSNGDVQWKALEVARQADADWRMRRSEALEQQIARFPRLFGWIAWLLLCSSMQFWNGYVRAAQRDPAQLPFGIGYSRVLMDLAGILLTSLLVGLWTVAAYGWLDRRKRELADLTREPETAEA